MKGITILFILLGIFTSVGITETAAQVQALSLEEAWQLARQNHFGLTRDQLAVQQQEVLANAGIPQPAAQLWLGGEEFNLTTATGLHTVGIQQQFYLPGQVSAQRRVYQEGARLAEKNLALTEQELKRAVTGVYFQLLFARRSLEIATENLLVYDRFLEIATAQLESGETGKLPQLAARNQLGQARLEREHAEERYQIALNLFNQWLGADGVYEATGGLPLSREVGLDTLPGRNPHLQIRQAQIELATAEVAYRKTQLQPQLSAGLRLQAAPGLFPLFGYQVGVNVPLFRRGYQGQIEAAEVALKREDAAFQADKQELERTIDELFYRLNHQWHILEYLSTELIPLVQEEKEANFQAYRAGEIGHVAYLYSLEQEIRIQQQYLEALYEFNILQTDLDYWLGKE